MSTLTTLAQLVQAAADALQGRALDEADRRAREVLARFGEEANALMVLGLVRLESGDADGAVSFLERARRQNPNHIHVLNNLGTALRLLARYEEARAVLENAIKLDRSFSAAHNNLGSVYLDLGRRDDARRCYARAIQEQADNADAIANLARLAEEEHRLKDALDLSLRALRLVPGHHQANLTQARVQMREGDVVRSADGLERLLALPDLPVNVRIVAQGHLAECREKLRQFDKAFDAFSAANDLQFNLHAPRFEIAAGYLSPKRIKQLFTFVGREDFHAWRALPDANLAPVFLVGFPRSGTTLLDQILSSHPHVTTLEERDTLFDVCRVMMPAGGSFDFWRDLAEHDVERMRSIYWAGVESALGGVSKRKVFIDKLPMNAVLLPLIYRLFPAARIVLALRDPRDVVLSCFQQRFELNEAMFQLLRLGSAAGYYGQVMGLVQTCRERVPLSLHAIKYEDVVSDFDATVRGLLGFLGLDWNNNVRNFSQTARERVVNTPSATQVVQPLYTTSVGKWRNYKAQMAETLPVLAPWVATFGYEP